MNTLTLGIDLAKNVFSLHGVNRNGKTVIRKTVKRQQLIPEVAKLPPALIGMEACSGAHYWARKFIKLGHDARIMAPKYVAPYRQGEKNDSNDAEAICEAVGRPKMRFVPVKTVHQQASLIIHRIRQGYVHMRTGIINQPRGLLSEFGIVMPKGRYSAQKAIRLVLEDAENDLPSNIRAILNDLFQKVLQLNEDILAYDRQINLIARQSEETTRIMATPGVGSQTATAVIATVGNMNMFRSGRQFSAWLGLAPRQYSTGGVTRLGRITKRGDKYLRTLLVHGARAVVARAKSKTDWLSQWVNDLIERRGMRRAIVAVAAKNARIIWALLTHKTEYQAAA